MITSGCRKGSGRLLLPRPDISYHQTTPYTAVPIMRIYHKPPQYVGVKEHLSRSQTLKVRASDRAQRGQRLISALQGLGPQQEDSSAGAWSHRSGG